MLSTRSGSLDASSRHKVPDLFQSLKILDLISVKSVRAEIRWLEVRYYVAIWPGDPFGHSETVVRSHNVPLHFSLLRMRQKRNRKPGKKDGCTNCLTCERGEISPAVLSL